MCRAVAFARASRDKSVYGEVMGMVRRLGRGGYHHTVVYMRVKVNARIPYADTVFDATRVSSTPPLFTARGTESPS